MIGENGIENVSWFVGYIEDNDDRNGRVRVRALGFHPTLRDGGVEREDLPWALVVRQGKQYTPFDIGELVVGFFLDGRDAQHPVVIGTLNTGHFSSPTVTNNIGNSGSVQYSNIGTAVNNQLGVEQRAFLDAIALKESGGSYTILSGGGDISIDVGHPNIKGSSGTTAAGRYQFTYGTWVDINGSNIPFTPENQDAAAWSLAEQRYRTYGLNRSLGYTDLNSYLMNNGVTPELLTGLSRTWEAFDPSLGNQSAIINAYNNSVSGQAGVQNTFAQFENPYVTPSQDAVDNFGNPALPPQVTGEGIEFTPVVVQAATRRTASFTGGHSISEPAGPSNGHVTNTSVWHTRYGGSNITLSGKNTTDEYVDITHASGSRVTLDGNGNITIKAMGRVFIGSEGDIEESSDGFKLAHHAGGYALEVSEGKVQIISAGDIEITTGRNLTLNSGGKMTFNAGDAIMIAGTKIAATARVDAIDLVAAGKMALHSEANGMSFVSVEGMAIQAGKKMSLRSGEDMTVQSKANLGIKAESSVGVQAVGGTLGLKSQGSATIASGVNVGFNASGLIMVKGSAIHLNSPGMDPADVPDAVDAEDAATAIASDVPNPTQLKVTGDTKPSASPTDLSPLMVDDTGSAGVFA